MNKKQNSITLLKNTVNVDICLILYGAPAMSLT